MTTVERVRSPVIAESLAAVAEIAARGAASPTEIAALVEGLGNAAQGDATPRRRGAGDAARAWCRGDAVVLRRPGGPVGGASLGRRIRVVAIGAAPPQALPVCWRPSAAPTAMSVGRRRRLSRAWFAPPSWLRRSSICSRAEPPRNVRWRPIACGISTSARRPSKQALYAALDDAESAVRIAALSSLARLCADRRAAALRVVTLLDGPDAGVRRAAAVALGALGARSDAVFTALRGAAAGADASLQRAAERSLRLLGG